jgi:hypothetical protein
MRILVDWTLLMKLRTLLGKKGFSILEIVIATVIIVVAFIPIFNLRSASHRAYKKSDNNAIAYNLAMEALEWARSFPYERLENKYINTKIAGYILPVALTDFVSDDGVAITYPQKFFKYFSDFKREMTIEKLGTDDRLKLVTVTVSWEEPNKQGTTRREEVVRAVVVNKSPI